MRYIALWATDGAWYVLDRMSGRTVSSGLNSAIAHRYADLLNRENLIRCT